MREGWNYETISVMSKCGGVSKYDEWMVTQDWGGGLFVHERTGEFVIERFYPWTSIGWCEYSVKGGVAADVRLEVEEVKVPECSKAGV